MKHWPWEETNINNTELVNINKYVLWSLLSHSFSINTRILTLKIVALLLYFTLKDYVSLFKISYFLLMPWRERDTVAVWSKSGITTIYYEKALMKHWSWEETNINNTELVNINKYVLWSSLSHSISINTRILTLKIVALLLYFTLKDYVSLFKISYFLLMPWRERNTVAVWSKSGITTIYYEKALMKHWKGTNSNNKMLVYINSITVDPL